MKGIVISFDELAKRGVLRDINDNHYDFVLYDWKSNIEPKPGYEVNFELKDIRPIDIFCIDNDKHLKFERKGKHFIDKPLQKKPQKMSVVLLLLLLFVIIIALFNNSTSTSSNSNNNVDNQNVYDFTMSYGDGPLGYSIGNQIDALIQLMGMDGYTVMITDKTIRSIGRDTYKVSQNVKCIETGEELLYVWETNMRLKKVTPKSYYARQLYNQ
ncbi:MAG: hypothetical protein P9L97_06580 [Candidatus Tenebribacter davisii]|nr:hypothetical protein [Candidatus Tenebribacter davisii]